MEPIHYLTMIRRRWWCPAVALLISVAAVVVTTPDTPKPVTTGPVASSFSATHVLLRQPDASRIISSNTSQVDMGLTAFYVTTGEVPKRVAAAIGFTGDPAALAAKVTAVADAQVPALRITATDSDPQGAVLLAETFAAELLRYLEELDQARYQRTVDAALARAEELQDQLRKLERTLPPGGAGDPTSEAQRDALARQYGNAFERYQQLVSNGPDTVALATVQQATPVPVTAKGSSFRPPESRSGRLVVLGGLGLLVGTAGAILIDRLDKRPRSKEEAEAAFGLPVIAEVPLLPRFSRGRAEIATVIAPKSMTAEAYRMLRTALLLMPRTSEAGGADAAPRTVQNGHAGNGHAPVEATFRPKVVLVTSPGPREGKSTSTANLATAFAEMGQSVLVLSFDLRCPRVHLFLGVDEGPGLTDVLGHAPGAPNLASVARLTDVPGVRLVTSGSETNPSEALVPPAAVIAEARTLADVVLIDASPLLTMSDAAELVPSVDAVLLIARAGHTGADAAARATELLERLGAPITGVALIGVRELPGRPRGYYEGYTEPTRSFRWRRGRDLVEPRPFAYPADPAEHGVEWRPAPPAPPAEPPAAWPAAPPAAPPAPPPAAAAFDRRLDAGSGGTEGQLAYSPWPRN